MKHTIINRKTRLLISFLSLAILIPTHVIIQYPNTPPNEVIRGYDVLPFFPVALFYIIFTGILIFRDLNALQHQDINIEGSFGYILSIIFLIICSIGYILQAHGLHEHYFGNGVIYPATYFPLLFQSMVLISIMFFWRRKGKIQLKNI